jgi:poly(hydroxyalkanoate) depolymerase family esterase
MRQYSRSIELMRAKTRLITVAAGGVALAALVAVLLTGATSSPGDPSDQSGRVTIHGDVYPYTVYVPPSRSSGSLVPLVVLLHGCAETPEQIAAASGFDAVAAHERFVVLYPDVDPTDAAQGGCWRGIWAPAADGRGRGDAAAIAAMTGAVIKRWRIDRTRVFAIGISAGAFEASILGASYPNLYAAIGIHSGAAYMAGARGCPVPLGPTSDAGALARAALAAMGARARVMPVIVFHGDADGRIPYSCGQQAVSQWLRTEDLVLEHERGASLPTAPTTVAHGVVPRGHAYTVRSYADRAGCVVVQFWTVHSMGHFWSGGSSNPAWARYSDPRGPSATAAAWAFFSHWSHSGHSTTCHRASG